MSILEKILALINAANDLVNSIDKKKLEEAIENAKSSGGDTTAIELFLRKK